MTSSCVVNRSNVAALIPSYREEAHIKEVAIRTRLQVDNVFVLDDGSPDETAARAREAGVEVIRHEINQGKGAAIKTGFRQLLDRGFLYGIILDGDGQHRPEEIPDFIQAANETKAQFLIGNRMTDTRTMPAVRKLTNSFMSWQISSRCGQPIPDTQCGFRMIHRDVVPFLFCESNAYEYETEMLFIAAREGFKIESVPISTVYGSEQSKIHPVRDTIRFIQLMQRYRRNSR